MVRRREAAKQEVALVFVKRRSPPVEKLEAIANTHVATAARTMPLALGAGVIYKGSPMLEDSPMASLQKDKTSGSARMRPRARLINVIGDELISDEPVAVVELVKNAYDADARKVSVRFEGASETLERIVVIDNGHGMSLQAVLDSWFEPGTATKRKGGKSPGGRPFQGAKGIGRFAAARLARHLFLQSRMADAPDAVYVLLDWGMFDEESYLDELTIDYETRAASIQPGTQLTLEGLRKRWEDSDFEELHARLSRLISPFEEIRDFEIELDIPARPDLSGTVEPPQLLLQPRYLLKGTLDATGSFSGEFQLDGVTTATFTQRKLGGTGVVPENCGPFSVEIRAWDRDREGLEPIAERTDQSITQIRRTLNAYCGVSIYRDGFRVHPYGEKGNDWLNLDLRSRQTPGKRLANNQIVGAIQISRDENANLRDRSTREGLVINPAYHEFQAWFMEIMLLLEEARYPLRPKRDVSTKADPIFESFDLTAARSAATTALGAEHPVTKSIIEAEKQVSEGVERIQEMFSRLLMSAGLGQMVDIVIHEIGAPLGKINRELVALEKKTGTVYPPTARSEIDDMCMRIKSWVVQIQSLRERLTLRHQQSEAVRPPLMFAKRLKTIFIYMPR